MPNLKELGRRGKRFERWCTVPWPRVAEGMQKTQRGHADCRGQVPGGVRLCTRRVEREEARKAVHGTLARGSAFCALRKACMKLREVMQSAEDRYLEVYAYKLEELTLARDMRGWYGHVKGGWKLQGNNVGSAQYIRDEDGKLCR